MIILTIGDTSRRLTSPAAVEQVWATLHMYEGGVQEMQPPVHIRVASPSLTLNLVAGEPAPSGGYGAGVEADESRVLELWRERGLDSAAFRSRQLIAFLHQLYDVLEQEQMHAAGAAV